ncbi:MAG TPA: biotin transporter BioY [Herpetosiphonaceae bacterium]|nr:biotin transporter BioY [Herpetosiphonaceae bacterium]
MLVVLFSAFVALSARIAIPLPFTEVPLTGQTLAVLLTGGVLGSRRGALALLLYLVEGAIGLPVFAPSAALPPGIGRLLGPTGGYLLSFPLVAGIVGLLAERGWDRRLGPAALAMLAGNLLIYLVAVPWLALFTGSLWLALAKGMLPFIPGDLLKIAIASVALPSAWTLVRREHDGS